MYLGGGGAWSSAKLLNHEVAHNLNLRHTWNENDYCSDTPFNNNCWNINFPANTNCDDWCEISNNMMDYNFSQQAISPCQINRMQDHLDGVANPYVYSCDGCMPTHSFFYMPESVCIPTEGKITFMPKVYIDGRGSWKEDSYQIEIYKVDNVGDIGQVGNTYHNSSYTGEVGQFNLSAIYNFQPGNVYLVKLVTLNDCGGHASIGWITVESGSWLEEPALEPPVGILPIPPYIVDPLVYQPSIPVFIEKPAIVQPIDREGESDDGNNESNKKNITTKSTIHITPNPAKGIVEVTYQVDANSDYQLSLVSIFGEQLQILEQGNVITAEERQLRFDSNPYPSGVYVVVLTTEKGKQTKQLIIAK